MKRCKFFVCIGLFFLVFSTYILPDAADADPLANWVTITSGTDHWFFGMTYGNGIFVTVGDFGTILTSPDGVAWTERDATVTNHLYGVGFGNNTFVAVGTLGKILTSPDGTTWTVRSDSQAHPVSQNLYGVAYGNSTFVVVGGHGAILTSTDNGVTWVDPFWPLSSPTANWLYATVYDTGAFVDAGAYGTVLTSPDAVNWNVETSGTALHLQGVAYGYGTFVAVGQSGTVLTSANGITWDVLWDEPEEGEKVTTEWLKGVAYDNGYFVAVGESGTIITSPDGTNWTLRTSGTSYDLEAVAYDSANAAFAAVGGYGTILLDGDTIPTLPVRIPEGSPLYYSSLQSAYDDALDGETIQSQAWHFQENLTFDRNISVTMEGGYDPFYTNNPQGSTINGSVTITDGTVTLEKIVIH